MPLTDDYHILYLQLWGKFIRTSNNQDALCKLCLGLIIGRVPMCNLQSPRFKCVDVLRFTLIKEKCDNGNILLNDNKVDLVLLQPRHGTLQQHIPRVSSCYMVLVDEVEGLDSGESDHD